MNGDLIGCGAELSRSARHPYLGRRDVTPEGTEARILASLNADRGRVGEFMEVDYYFEVSNSEEAMSGLENAARMVLEHGTLKSWRHEGGSEEKPAGYDGFMSWVTGIRLLGYNRREEIESGIVTVAYPIAFFDKSEAFPFAQLMMAAASEPYSAFYFYKGAKVIDIRLPKSLIGKFPPPVWNNRRVLDYLRLSGDEPIIGTIVKPKTGLTPEIFAQRVTEAAQAGARFTKADENMHLTLEEIPIYVSAVVKALTESGFDLGRADSAPHGVRFLFAPHITGNPDEMMARAEAAVNAGANALMFSPYYGGGFALMREISDRFDVPVYAHTAGMNVYTGSLTWGIDPSVMYRFAAYYGAAFMQLTAINGYLKPDDTEKKHILDTMGRDGLLGPDNMTLVIAGGLGAGNIGENMKVLGGKNRMFLAGTSVYSHPDGPSGGVKSILLAYQAYIREGLTSQEELLAYADKMGAEGQPLLRALR